jgi:hypothetical protein
LAGSYCRWRLFILRRFFAHQPLQPFKHCGSPKVDA